MTKMISKAAITDGNGGVTIGKIEVHAPKADEVLVKMVAAGICHTDYDSMSWGQPLIMGHEGAGIVVMTGEDVAGVAQGDRVILNWATPCGHCFQCLRGNQNICENNSPVVAGGNGYTPGHADLAGTTWKGRPIVRSFNLGTLAEYTLVKSSAVVPCKSDHISLQAACIIGCGVMTGFGSVVNVAKVMPGSSVVVIGAGGVGLNVIQGARICGATTIIAIDVNPHKLDAARTFGATHTVLALRDDQQLQSAVPEVKELTDGRGADYAFECTAIPRLGATPLAMVRNAGMAVQVSGIEEEIDIDMRLFEWDKVYLNPLYGKCQPQIDFPKIVALYDDGELLLDELVTKTYKLEELETALSDMLSGNNIKGVVTF